MSTLSPAKITERVDWTDGLATLRLDRSAEFTPGQFFNLALRVGEETVRRSYSAASAPGQPLEFYVSRVKEGGLTPHLLDLKPQDELLLDEKPLGFFTLEEVPETKRLWLVSTGTGLGPYISMARSGALHERFEQIVFVHGVRHENQLGYHDELMDLASSAPKFRYICALSGAAESQHNALRGRIPQTFADGSLEKAAGPFDAECHMLLCGNPDMIEATTELLKARGFEKHRRKKAGHFNFEKYW